MSSADSIPDFLQSAIRLYSRLVFAGHTEGWEEIDRVLRSDAADAAKLAALRYHLANHPAHRFPLPLQNAITRFLEGES